MAEFKKKPLPDELTAALRAGVQGVPSAVVVGPQPVKGGEGGRPRAPKTVQVNFNCTEDMARLIAHLAAEAGSTRRMFARLLSDAGHPVPSADLQPIDNRRRWAE